MSISSNSHQGDAVLLDAMDGNVAELKPLGVPAEKVSKIAGWGRTKTFEMIRSGELESVKVGRSRIVTMRSIRRLLHGEDA